MRPEWVRAVGGPAPARGAIAVLDMSPVSLLTVTRRGLITNVMP